MDSDVNALPRPTILQDTAAAAAHWPPAARDEGHAGSSKAAATPVDHPPEPPQVSGFREVPAQLGQGRLRSKVATEAAGVGRALLQQDSEPEVAVGPVGTKATWPAPPPTAGAAAEAAPAAVAAAEAAPAPPQPGSAAQGAGASPPQQTRPPAPPPPPAAGAPIPALGVVAAQLTVVNTAEELVQALSYGALDVELQSHIDTRHLNFTAVSQYGQQADCIRAYGSETATCGHLMYLESTRSIRGNCNGPPSEEIARNMKLPESAEAGLRNVRPGQCVLIINKSAIQTSQDNKWFDNLHIGILGEGVVAETITAVSVTRARADLATVPGISTNLFFTRMVFQVLDELQSAAAIVIPVNVPDYSAGAQRTRNQSRKHSLLIQDTEFIGFKGTEPPLAIGFESYASFHHCMFQDFDLSVEVFDVSYGGRISLENCTFQNIQLRQNPPKYVSTLANDELRCSEPGSNDFKYYSDDDDAYDIEPQPIDPNDTSKGLYAASATMSDCLYPVNRCLPPEIRDLPAPGCPQESVATRRFNNHNNCGRTHTPGKPYYYDDYSDTYVPADYYYLAEEFVLSPGEVVLPGPTFFEVELYEDRNCFFYEPVEVYEPGGPVDTSTYYQWGFITDQHYWFSSLRRLLPQNNREGEEAWSWPQVAQASTESTNNTLKSSATVPVSNEASNLENFTNCSGKCIPLVSTATMVLLLIAAGALLLLVLRRRRKASEGSKERSTEASGYPSQNSATGQSKSTSRSARQEGPSGTIAIATPTQLDIWFPARAASSKNLVSGAFAGHENSLYDSKPSPKASSSKVPPSSGNPDYTFQLLPGLSLALDKEGSGSQPYAGLPVPQPNSYTPAECRSDVLVKEVTNGTGGGNCSAMPHAIAAWLKQETSEHATVATITHSTASTALHHSSATTSGALEHTAPLQGSCVPASTPPCKGGSQGPLRPPLESLFTAASPPGGGFDAGEPAPVDTAQSSASFRTPVATVGDTFPEASTEDSGTSPSVATVTIPGSTQEPSIPEAAAAHSTEPSRSSAGNLQSTTKIPRSHSTQQPLSRSLVDVPNRDTLTAGETAPTQQRASTVQISSIDEVESEPSRALLSKGVSVFGTDTAHTKNIMHQLGTQLDRFKRRHLFLGQFEMLGHAARRKGGQAVVQFARRPQDGREFAVKFFLDSSAFHTETALYAAYFPELRKQLRKAAKQTSNFCNTTLCKNVSCRESTGSGYVKGDVMPTDLNTAPTSLGTDRVPEACPGLLQPNSSNQELQALSGVERINTGRIAGARFLPHVESVCDSAEAGLVDPRGHELPPCIVMERGESLQEWSERAVPDRFTAFAVLTNIAQRMKDMHAAGYAHRDLKPANVVLLPRENRWTVIDFGCAARIGCRAPLAFSLTYSPPEVIRATEAGDSHIAVLPAVDVWALGVMAFELLTGAPAFRIVTDGIVKVVEALLGQEPLPWERELSEETLDQLGTLHEPILAMLSRDPSLRPSMADAYSSIINMERKRIGGKSESPLLETSECGGAGQG